MPQPKFSTQNTLLPPILEVGGGASAEEGALREDAATNPIAEEENRQMAPLLLDLRKGIIMREHHRIPQQIPKAGKFSTQDPKRVMIFGPAFFADDINIQQGFVRNT